MSKAAVIANIQAAVAAQTFNAKVEVGDPTLTPAAEAALLTHFEARRGGLSYAVNNRLARAAMAAVTLAKARPLTVHGQAHLAQVPGGAIVTSNHFSPWENMVVRRALGMRRLFIVSQATNLKMPGALGYMMTYADTLPLGRTRAALTQGLTPRLAALLAAGQRVLIYPEQEMWYQYRKPRPPRRGAYYFAAKFNVPILPCFVAMTPLAAMVDADFHAVRYDCFILAPIFPDPACSVRANSQRMMAKDYQQKVAAYEAAYGEPLDYAFTPRDIVGWTGG